MKLTFDLFANIEIEPFLKQLLKEYNNLPLTIEKTPQNALKCVLKAFKANTNIIIDSMVHHIALKRFDSFCGNITSKQFLKEWKYFERQVKHSYDYFHVMLVDESLSGFNEFILKNTIKLCQKFNINYIVINVNEIDEINSLREFLGWIKKS